MKGWMAWTIILSIIVVPMLVGKIFGMYPMFITDLAIIVLFAGYLFVKGEFC